MEQIFDNVDNMAELKYMFDYQINHMYIRYFLWNFVGRASDEQDAPAAWFTKNIAQGMNYKSGYAYLYPIRYFAIPLLFGLLGLFFHFWRDPKIAFVYLIMFLLMGVLMALAQNQQNPQPRERDYFYPGSFIIWCIWIGMGAYMLIEWLSEAFKQKKLNTGLVSIILLVSLIIVPVNLAANNWKSHSRAGNYLAFDYSYNILQSVEKNSILFTAGDNDTFPVWFLQDVMGVRRDVRIVNLSLGNTLWYIDQLKNREPWGAEKIPLSFPDRSLQVNEYDEDALSYEKHDPITVKIPVRKEILKQYTNDPNLINKGGVEVTFKGIDRNGTMYFRVQDQLVMDIVRQTRFERPVYFSTTASDPDNFAGLSDFLRQEGMAMRVCPVKQQNGLSYVASDPKIMDACFLHADNTNNFSKTPKYGMKFRNLNNPSVYYDRVQTNYIYNYRRLFTSYANNCYDKQKDKQKTIEVLDKMNEYFGIKQFPMLFNEEFQVSQLYRLSGDTANARKFEDMCIESCYYVIENPDKISWRAYRLSDIDMLQFTLDLSDNARIMTVGPYSTLVYIYNERGQTDKAMDVMELLYAHWMKQFMNPAYRSQLNAVLNKSQTEQLTEQESRVRFRFINLLHIQRAFVDYTILSMKGKAAPADVIKKIVELKKRFKNDINGDPLLELLNKNFEPYANQKIQSLRPKSDSLGTSDNLLPDTASASDNGGH